MHGFYALFSPQSVERGEHRNGYGSQGVLSLLSSCGGKGSTTSSPQEVTISLEPSSHTVSIWRNRNRYGRSHRQSVASLAKPAVKRERCRDPLCNFALLIDIGS
jgi:hypothetical protein